MAGMTQKELKKPYFHCGPIGKGKYQHRVKDFKGIKTKNDDAKILTYICCIMLIISLYLLFIWKNWFFILCLKVFKEADVLSDLSTLFHKEGPTYDKALKP